MLEAKIFLYHCPMGAGVSRFVIVIRCFVCGCAVIVSGNC